MGIKYCTIEGYSKEDVGEDEVMVYREILIELIDPNPFQVRKDFDSEVLAGIATSAMDNIGIRNAPLVRVNPDNKNRYQIASGHSRVNAVKILGLDKIICRVEEFTDSQMKKEVLVENVNRTDLDEDERYNAVEQYRLDPYTNDEKIKQKLMTKEHGWLAELNRQTGVHEKSLSRIYDVKFIREELKIRHVSDSKISQRLIDTTRGLEIEDRLKLIIKSKAMKWDTDAVQEVKTVIQKMDESVKAIILDKKTNLLQSVIIKLSEVNDSDKQIALIERIKSYDYGEKSALDLIDRTIKGTLPEEITVVDEYKDEMKKINSFVATSKTFGMNSYGIVGESGWIEAERAFREVKKQMDWLLRKGWIDNLE